MMFAAVPIPLSACLLADHLDAVLAAGEDLLKVRGTPPPPVEDPVETILTARSAQRRAVERIRSIEAALLARVMTARERAAELGKGDARFKIMARLFASGTAMLADAVAECKDSTASDFQTGDGVTSYLRGRNALSANVLAVAERAEIAVDESFLLGKQAPLGVLMDLAAQFLDTLEEHFDLYGVDIDEVDAYANAERDGGEPDGAETRGADADEPLPRFLTSEPRIDGKSHAQVDSAGKKDAGAGSWASGSLRAALAMLESEHENLRRN